MTTIVVIDRRLISMETPETPKVPRPPEGLGATGRALWRDTVAGYTFTATELGVLRELCRAHDNAARLTTTSKSVSVTLKGSRGQPARLSRVSWKLRWRSPA